MIAKYNRWSLMFGVPGVIVQIAGVSVFHLGQRGPTLPGALSILFGGILLTIGLAFYAKAKGRSFAWCIMGIFGIIGLAVLAALEDKAKSIEEAGEEDEPA